jgi:hypothetical protein
MKYMIIFLIFVLSRSKPFQSQKYVSQSNLYTKLIEFNKFNLDSSYLLISFDSNTILRCFTRCTKTTECFFVAFQQNKCFLCSFNLIYFSNYSSDGNSLIYQKKFNTTNNLINYWTFNGNVNDSIGNAHMYGGVNATLTFDRFGRSNSALNLTSGYYKVPLGVYFKGTQLTIMAWVNVKSYESNSRLIDFGNGKFSENVVLVLTYGTGGKPYLYFRSGAKDLVGFSNKILILNKWQHLACVFSFPYYSIYIDGIEATTPGSKSTFTAYSITNVVRSTNHIGRSSWPDQDADAVFDDLKFFNRSLSPREILFEMNNNL